MSNVQFVSLLPICLDMCCVTFKVGLNMGLPGPADHTVITPSTFVERCVNYICVCNGQYMLRL